MYFFIFLNEFLPLLPVELDWTSTLSDLQSHTRDLTAACRLRQIVWPEIEHCNYFC